MRSEETGEFEYSLERSGYDLFDFDEEFKEIAEDRGWSYIECYFKD